MAIEKSVVSLNLAEEKAKLRIIRNYEKWLASKPENAEVMNILGCLYLELKSQYEDKREENRSIAREYFEEAIQLGHKGAQYNLWLLDMLNLSELAKEFEHYGYSHEKGLDVEDNGSPNLEKAIVMYENAIDSYEGLIHLLNNKLICSYDDSEEYQKMIADNKRRAEIGKERAKTNKQRAEIANQLRLLDIDLGDKLYNSALKSEIGIRHNGKPNKPNYPKAIKRYRMAIKRGDKRAEIALERLAVKFFTEAREQYNMGEVSKAIALYEKAAKLNHADAMVALGLIYESNEADDNPDYKKAIEWYETAIACGSTKAMMNRANLYKIGAENNGVSEYEKAIQLYKKAIKLGDKSAESLLRALEKKMRLEQRPKAEGQENMPVNRIISEGPHLFRKRKNPIFGSEIQASPLKRAKMLGSEHGIF